MYKNVASQKVAIFAWNGAAGTAKTGDAANITAEISKDGGASAATNDTNPTELDAVDHPGVYIFDMLQAETNADLVIVTPVSSTTDVIFRPIIIYTELLTSTKVGYIDAPISTVNTVVDGIQTDLSNATDGLGALKALIDALNDLSAAQVNAEVVDALNVDTYAEPGQEAPPATTTLVKKISYLYKAWRNKKDNDGTTRNLYGDDAATVDQKSPVAEAAGTVTTDEWGSGP